MYDLFPKRFQSHLLRQTKIKRKKMRETAVNIKFSKATVRMPMRNIVHNGRRYYLIWTKLAQRALRPQISRDTLQQRSSVQWRNSPFAFVTSSLMSSVFTLKLSWNINKWRWKILCLRKLVTLPSFCQRSKLSKAIVFSFDFLHNLKKRKKKRKKYILATSCDYSTLLNCQFAIFLN